jgi:thiamine-phosphate pyrophosphorylase
MRLITLMRLKAVSRDGSNRMPSAEFRIPPLNAIVDADMAAQAAWPLIDLAAAYLHGGATFLQLRAKSMASGPFLETAKAIAELTRAAGAILVVNDRADIARLADANGVHVGQDDLAPAAVRSIVGKTQLVGVSTHTPGQLEAMLREPVDYVAIGPVFATATKDTGYAAIGLDRVRAAASAAGAVGLPLVAIGGITLERAGEVINSGAASVAVIGDLLSTGNPEARVREYLIRLGHELERNDRPNN